jgi:DNA-binding IclR family transcriptional regulator
MDDGSDNIARNGIQVIARAAAILRTLKETQTGMSLAQIAAKLDLPRSTVQRIVTALQDERLVIASATGGGLRLGPELHALAGAARYDIVERCRPFLNTLAQTTGETVDLSVLRAARIIFLDQVQGTHRLRTISCVGEVFPLTTTANGRACLSLLSDADATRLAHAEWAQLGVKGNTAALLALLANVRDTGLAYDLDDHTPGISAVGFAFRDPAGDLHSISVPVPSTRFEDRRNIVVAALTALRPEVIRMME